MNTKEDEPLRILMVTDAFLPHAGGSRQYYYNLFKRIARLGDDVTIQTSKVSGWLEFDLAEQTSGFRIKRNFRPLRDLRYSELPRLLGPLSLSSIRSIFHRPDILHCGDLYPPGLIGVFLKKILHIPYVAYCHGEDITQTDARRFQPKLRNLIYRSADAVIANGEFAVQNLLRIGITSEKIHKITPGLDTNIFFPLPPANDLRDRYGIKNELVVVTVSRLIPRKGHARMIRAIAALGSDVPPVKYVIVGRGALEAELRALATELKIEDKVIFAGFVAQDQLNQHYNLADIVAMPNTEEAGDIEGFGMVFLEANAAGKPVIGGRSGGTSEAVADGETGFLVDAETDSELQSALRRLLVDQDLRLMMGERGLQRARTEFGWDSRADKLRAISHEIVASRQFKRRSR